MKKNIIQVIDNVADDYDCTVRKDDENSNVVMIDDKNNYVPKMNENVVLEKKFKDNNNTGGTPVKCTGQ